MFHWNSDIRIDFLRMATSSAWSIQLNKETNDGDVTLHEIDLLYSQFS